jgi:hypothetical protein
MTTQDDIQDRWRSLVQAVRVSNRSEALRQDLVAFQAEVQEQLIGPAGSSEQEVSPDDPRLQVLLDALRALALIDNDDPSWPWERGGLLARCGRHLEAADDYLASASLSMLDACNGTSAVDDPEEWAKSAYGHAARELIRGGQLVAAAALLPALDRGDRDEIEGMLAGVGTGRLE